MKTWNPTVTSYFGNEFFTTPSSKSRRLFACNDKGKVKQISGPENIKEKNNIELSCALEYKSMTMNATQPMTVQKTEY